ncbi:hypothetical protein GCM10009527_098170 [Actinomadura nitritigenes]|uniref:VRR-NUC domain-containing protein n=1 Tax=Actinomadura nitritigenes TaxID=134602 RepID=A0ABS3QWN6_9ACTN|nr:hypothetical protein [Actinomadura nitritigenes]MBO2438261.1 hypothetical protein [Actinomadura nitritigenes]
MNEPELEREVRRLLVEHGLMLRAFHVPDARGMTRGLPDWIIIGRTVLWRELKSAHGGVRPEQWAIGDALLAAGEDWAIWRPADLASGRILAELQHAARPDKAGPPDE